MKSLQSLLAIALLSAGTAVLAQQETPPSAKNPATNPVGTPTPTDPPRDATTPRTMTPPAATMPMKSFEQYDTNGDGTISAAEFSPANAKGMTIAQIDANGDGKLSRDEWNAHKKAKEDTQRK
ncbi:EF-hand domain-containing protein [Tahibacter soli]|uniref:EF-hand domain-containing protein n=1 Tax=Tahibacter soli TaxID=2983605 RepID=A0A9X3YQW6_9GAMM|nr:EF-hand domain-containing protein [Tahibacter soli]MDC8016099.1 EF-hand domain-containing protein [Tahibacter soli]